MQPLRGGLHGLEQITAVEAVHQVGDDLGIGLAGEDIALGLQLGAQGFVVFDDAVVHEGHAGRLVGIGHGRDAGAVAEMRMGVAHGRLAMRGPAGMGNAGVADDLVLLHLGHEFGHARRGTGALQALAVHALGVQRLHGHAAGVIAAIFQALQALDENGDDIAEGNRCDDATHGQAPCFEMTTDATQVEKKFLAKFLYLLN